MRYFFFSVWLSGTTESWGFGKGVGWYGFSVLILRLSRRNLQASVKRCKVLGKSAKSIKITSSSRGLSVKKNKKPLQENLGTKVRNGGGGGGESDGARETGTSSEKRKLRSEDFSTKPAHFYYG